MHAEVTVCVANLVEELVGLVPEESLARAHALEKEANRISRLRDDMEEAMVRICNLDPGNSI